MPREYLQRAASMRSLVKLGISTYNGLKLGLILGGVLTYLVNPIFPEIIVKQNFIYFWLTCTAIITASGSIWGICIILTSNADSNAPPNRATRSFYYIRDNILVELSPFVSKVITSFPQDHRALVRDTPSPASDAEEYEEDIMDGLETDLEEELEEELEEDYDEELGISATAGPDETDREYPPRSVSEPTLPIKPQPYPSDWTDRRWCPIEGIEQDYLSRMIDQVDNEELKRKPSSIATICTNTKAKP